jgi:orotidine-5'-phosphate decarboxylase
VCHAVQTCGDGDVRKPLVFAVTALTSLDDGACTRVYGQPCKETAERLAKEVLDTGIDGLVCSVHESRNLKSLFNRPFLTLVPGIRPFDPEKVNVVGTEAKKVVVTDKPARKVGVNPDMGTNDQKRVGNIQDAKEAQADYIVVGRPIYQATDPRAAIASIMAQMIDK